MRTYLIHLSAIYVFFILPFSVEAQYEEIYDFDDTTTFNGTDLESNSGLTLVGDYYYGLKPKGGVNDRGTLFRVKVDGSDFDKIIDFDSTAYGSHPYGSLHYDGTHLYGTTRYGGVDNEGTVFKTLPDGTGYERILDFGAQTSYHHPIGSIVSDGTYLYGSVIYDDLPSPNGEGAIFRMLPDGNNFQIVKDFASTNLKFPYGSIITDSTYIYGTTEKGGVNDDGSIFKVRTDGSNFTLLHNFDHSTSGSWPRGPLMLNENSLYGMTQYGGDYTNGTLFKIDTSGTSFNKLYDFNDSITGKKPEGSLHIEDSVIYGHTCEGGLNDSGTMFRIDSTGNNFEVLIDFSNDLGDKPQGTIIKNANNLLMLTSHKGEYYGGTLLEFNLADSTTNVLHDFGRYKRGKIPSKEMVLVNEDLYGTTLSGGENNSGTIFKIEKDGSNHEIIYTFNGDTSAVDQISSPQLGLVYDGEYLYGVSRFGGDSSFHGTIYRIKPDGSQLSIILDFNFDNGSQPKCLLAFDTEHLYGTTESGGDFDKGVIFRVDKDGQNYVKMHDFEGGLDGEEPKSLLLVNDTLYGVTSLTPNSTSTIFKIGKNSTGYEVLHSFTNNSLTGHNPQARLIYHNNKLYGTCRNGGSANSGGYGTIFSINLDGTNFETLHAFAYAEGMGPMSRLEEYDGYLYGTTYWGGDGDGGTLYRIRDNGSHFEKLIDFKDETNGYFVQHNLIFDGEYFYGSTGRDQRVLGEGILFRYKPYDFCSSTSTDIISSCDPITWIDGNVYDSTTIIPTYTLTNSNGCDSTIFLDFTILPNLGFENSQYPLVASAQNASYQWVDCNNDFNPIPGETNREFYFTTNGSYAVIVNQNGCVDTSGCIEITDASNNINPKHDQVRVYPNPTHGIFHVETNRVSTIDLFDGLGRQLDEINIESKSHTLDLSNRDDGVYFVVVYRKSNRSIHKIIIR